MQFREILGNQNLTAVFGVLPETRMLEIWILGSSEIWILGSSEIWILGSSEIWILGSSEIWILGQLDELQVLESKYLTIQHPSFSRARFLN
jgi:hypothetical protein